MQKSSKLFWSCLAGTAALVCFSSVNAAAPRSMVGAAGAGRTTTTARMPTMPTMSINTIGTHAISGVSSSGTTTNNNNNNNNSGNTGNSGSTSDSGLTEASSDCPDGKKSASDFTVDNCMQSIKRCVIGALPNGLNDLFNEDLRNSVISGMGICASEIDKCIREVRVDCRNVYSSSTDVWLDFNSRMVQPEYYNFVLRKTGLTPNQAKNVCELLDKNVYGKSFAAVSSSNNVTSEYNNKIGAYNEQSGGNLSKNMPQGAMVNTTANGNITGVDGERGHYARWDATSGVCKIRVAAYNKDKMITNKWLFGALGDDKAAEVWQDAGSTFTCNKDLFDFSLLNNTHTMAVAGMGGGTLVGAGIGALTGHKARDFDCGNDDMRKELAKQISKNGLGVKLSKYLDNNISLSNSSMEESQCEEILNLYDDYVNLDNALQECKAVESGCILYGSDGKVIETFNSANASKLSGLVIDETAGQITYDGQTYTPKAEELESLKGCYALYTRTGSLVKNCDYKSVVNIEKFKDALCDGTIPGCVPQKVAESQRNELRNAFAKLEILKGQKSTVLKNTLIGGGIGLGVGGVATAITAFVERSNISCHVGDGLSSVGFNKSYTIDTLKDYYVKWNLHVADSVLPNTIVSTCQQWIEACGMYDQSECAAVDLNYQRPGRNTTTLVRNACAMRRNVCTANASVAVSYGACDRTPNNNGGGNNSDDGSHWLSQHIEIIHH